jgi:HTH-type transcriptional regulator/antitoxin HigA
MIIKWFGFDLLERTQSMIRLTLMKFNAMEIKPIKTEKDYNQALERLEIIFDAKPALQKVMNLKFLGF